MAAGQGRDSWIRLFQNHGLAEIHITPLYSRNGLSQSVLECKLRMWSGRMSRKSVLWGQRGKGRVEGRGPACAGPWKNLGFHFEWEDKPLEDFMQSRYLEVSDC